jgi:hypothetical protein
MGIRGEIFSTKVNLQNRTYFFNVKENRLGDLYLNIVESKNRDTGGFERQSVILFADDLGDFLKGFDDALRVLEKSAREKKRSGNAQGDRTVPKEKRSREAGVPASFGERRGSGQAKSGKARFAKKPKKDDREAAGSRKLRPVRVIRRKEE